MEELVNHQLKGQSEHSLPSLFTEKVNMESETFTHQILQHTIKDCFMVKEMPGYEACAEK